MKEILIAISLLSIKAGDANENASTLQIRNNWLGFEPAQSEEIIKAEKRLHVIFPEDYKEFLKITDGFSAPNTVEPTFMKVEDIDLLKNIDPELVKIWGESDAEMKKILEKCIMIAGKDQEQYFLLIPNGSVGNKWRYWKFANWIPGEYEFEDLHSYFKDVLGFYEEENLNNK